MPEFEKVYKIWFIEDNKFFIKLFLAANKKFGYELLEHFSTFDGAKTALENSMNYGQRPDVVLIDGNLHEGPQDNSEGRQLTNLARQHKLITVGFSSTGTVGAHLEPGRKFKPNQLHTILRKFFEGSKD